jgi:hypothetical protein
MSQIKLIWDFRGPESEKTAAHHSIHLAQYVQKFGLIHTTCGHNQISDLHWIAWVCVDEKDMISTRDALRPHRGQRIEQL